MAASLACRGRRLDVAVAVTGAAVVVSVLVAAVALRDGIRGLGRCHGRPRGWRGGRRRRGAACAGLEWAWLCAAPAGFDAAGCLD